MYDTKMLKYLMLQSFLLGLNIYLIANHNKEFSILLMLLYMISCAAITQIILNLIIFNRNLQR